MRTYAADDGVVSQRFKAMRERSMNVCYNRLVPRPAGDCWCKVLAAGEGVSALPCPPDYVEPK
jgi:hypothetical protein